MMKINRCWIKFEPDPWGELWRWLCFYIPLWGSITYVAVVYYKIWGQLTAPEPQRRNSGAAAPTQIEAVTSNTGQTTNADEEREIKPVVRPSASDVFNDATGHNAGGSSAGDVISGYQPSVTDVTVAKGASVEDNQPPKSGGGTLQRIKFYPFVLFGCYLFATIRRIAEWASADHVAPFGIAACQVFTSALLVKLYDHILKKYGIQ